MKEGPARERNESGRTKNTVLNRAVPRSQKQLRVVHRVTARPSSNFSPAAPQIKSGEKKSTPPAAIDKRPLLNKSSPSPPPPPPPRPPPAPPSVLPGGPVSTVQATTAGRAAMSTAPQDTASTLASRSLFFSTAAQEGFDYTLASRGSIVAATIHVDDDDG